MMTRRICNVFLLFVIGLEGCISCREIPSGPCSMESLLLNRDDLPVAVFTETGTRSANGAPARIGIERIGTSFSSTNQGGLNQSVYRFLDSEDAKKEILGIIEYEFSGWETWEEIPLGVDIRADLYKIGCTKTAKEHLLCRYVAQYDVYLIDFDASLVILDFSSFVSVVQRIDEKASLCLGN